MSVPLSDDITGVRRESSQKLPSVRSYAEIATIFFTGNSNEIPKLFSCGLTEPLLYLSSKDLQFFDVAGLPNNEDPVVWTHGNNHGQ